MKVDAAGGANPTELVTGYIAALGDWRGEVLARLRGLIHEVDPEITEDWMWETPVFAHKGSVCAAAAFKEHAKLNFFKGASLPDPKGLFNAGLDAKKSRAIDFHLGEAIDEPALKELIRAAVALNLAVGKK